MKLMPESCAICGCVNMNLTGVDFDGKDLYCAFRCNKCNKGSLQKAIIKCE